jgi:hypothetical protein
MIKRRNSYTAPHFNRTKLTRRDYCDGDKVSPFQRLLGMVTVQGRLQ